MTQTLPTQSIDPAFIAAVARKVIDRLRAAQAVQPASVGTPASVEPLESVNSERLVTVETLSQYQDDDEVVVAAGGIVTPAAKDEARRRNIALTRQTKTHLPGLHHSGSTIRNEANPAIDDDLGRQLAQRGVTFPANVELIWTDTPAKDVFARCQLGKTAAMVTGMADVDRFAKELAPNCWVLDRHKLNLVAAVNIAVRIAHHSREASR